MESMFQLLQREDVVVYLSIVGSKFDFFLLENHTMAAVEQPLCHGNVVATVTTLHRNSVYIVSFHHCIILTLVAYIETAGLPV